MNSLSGSIVLVDDDEDDLMLMQAAISSQAAQLKIETLTDGEELLPHLHKKAGSPSLIIMDLNMNRMSGFQVLKVVRSMDAYRQLPVIMLTTSSDPADKQRSVTLGASDFYTKPASFSELAQLANQLIRQWVMKPAA